MLGDGRAGAGGDQRGHGGDVDGAGAVAAGSAGVDEAAVDVHVDPFRVGEHGPYERGELGGGFTFGSEGERERGDLGVGSLPGKDRGQRGLRERGVEVLAAGESPEHLGPEGNRFGHRGPRGGRRTVQSHQRSRSRTPRAMSPSCIWVVPSTIVSCFASR